MKITSLEAIPFARFTLVCAATALAAANRSTAVPGSAAASAAAFG